jgi:hypothetical protein
MLPLLLVSVRFGYQADWYTLLEAPSHLQHTARHGWRTAHAVYDPLDK